MTLPLTRRKKCVCYFFVCALVYIQFLVLLYLHTFRNTYSVDFGFSQLKNHTVLILDHGENTQCLRRNKYVWSAYNRTHSESCRKIFIGLGCTSFIYDNFSRSLCHTQENLNERPSFLGCYLIRLNELKVVKPGEYKLDDDCISICRSLGVAYSWLGPNRTCWCRMNFPDKSSGVSLSQCSMNCVLGERGFSEDNHLCPDLVPVRIYATKANPPYHPVPLPLKSGLVDLQLTEPIRIVYLLVWNGRSWFHIRRMFKLIYHIRHYFYIHVDARCDYLFTMVKSFIRNYPPNVYITPTRLSPVWGGQSLLDMFLSSLKDLSTNMRDWKWDFVINLSESDMPIRPNHELVTYLSHNRDKIFLRSFSHTGQSFLRNQGFGQLFLECDSYVWHLGERPIPPRIILDGGSDWMILPKVFVDYVIHSEDRLIHDVKEYFRYSLLPVESFFHTVAQNTHFCTSVINHYLRFINWKRPQGCGCKYGSVVDWCGCSPLTLNGPKDAESLCELTGKCLKPNYDLQPLFFARKFDSTIDIGIINFIVSKLLERHDIKDNINSDNYYLENIYSKEENLLTDNPHQQTLHLALNCLSQRLMLQLFGTYNHNQDIFYTQLSLLNSFALFNATGWQEFNSSPSDELLNMWVDKRNTAPSLILQIQLPVLMEMNDFGEKYRYIVEFLIHPPSFSFLSSDATSSLSPGDIGFLEISSNFDIKEQIFRNYPRFLTLQDQLTVLILWKGNSDHRTYKTSVVFTLINPLGIPCSNQLTLPLVQNEHTMHSLAMPDLYITTSLIKSTVITNCVSTHISGEWSVLAVASSGQVSRVKFVLLDQWKLSQSFKFPHKSFAEEKLFNSEEWDSIHFIDFCTIQRSTTIKELKSLYIKNISNSNLVISNILLNQPHDDCSTVHWSSFFKDSRL